MISSTHLQILLLKKKHLFQILM